MYGYDVLEQDYFRLDRYEEKWAEKEARKKLKIEIHIDEGFERAQPM